MERNLSISEELEGISRAVADIHRGMPYTAPDGYFEGLAPLVMARLKRTPYAVEPAYFEEFADKLLARIKAAQTAAPDEELSVLSPLLSRLDKKMPFRAPEGYFSELAGIGIPDMQASAGKDGDELSPLLSGIRSKVTYQAPEGYFEDFAGILFDRLQEEEEEYQDLEQSSAKVISISSRRRNTGMKFWNPRRFMAAASIAALTLLGGRMLFQRSAGNPGPDVVKSLANVSDQDIQSYLDNQNIPLAEVINNSTATLDLNDSDVKDILGDVPDDELNAYLDDQDKDGKEPVTN